MIYNLFIHFRLNRIIILILFYLNALKLVENTRKYTKQILLNGNTYTKPIDLNTIMIPIWYSKYF